MIPIEERAWKIYCKETAGSMDVKDFWEELSPRVKRVYIDKVREKDIKKYG